MSVHAMLISSMRAVVQVAATVIRFLETFLSIHLYAFPGVARMLQAICPLVLCHFELLHAWCIALICHELVYSVSMLALRGTRHA